MSPIAYESARYNAVTHKAVPKDAVVLDFRPSRDSAKGLVDLLRRNFWIGIADQIEEQTKPPRIPEPKGFAPVVEAGVKQHGARLRWTSLGDGVYGCEDPDEYDRIWEDLVDPVLIRPGA